MEVTRKPHLHQDWIDSHAYGIVKALQKNDFTTYLVGGCVRDLLLNIHPKDYDIATMAHPPQVKRLIYMSFIIGKRFRLVLVKRDQQQFEVATFRREVRADEFPEGVPFGDNVFGTPEEDARRRDFTINALFYDPIADQLIDYVDGLPDIEKRVLRMIGDPDVRLVEDSIRILRGLRFAHKVGFLVEPTLRASMMKNAVELRKAALPRKREEILKILRLDEPALALLECFDLGILEHVLPTLHDFLQTNERRDLFLEHFEAYRSLVNDPADTVQLFGWLVYAMYQAARSGPTMRETPITIDDDVFQNLMSTELGMYRFEQTVLTKAIELLPSMSKTEEFQRRGERRQYAFMKNEGFRLALRIAEVDFLLEPKQLAFWRAALERLNPELREAEAEMKTKRRRRPRRKREGGEGRGAADDDLDLDADLDDDLGDDIDALDVNGAAEDELLAGEVHEPRRPKSAREKRPREPRSEAGVSSEPAKSDDPASPTTSKKTDTPDDDDSGAIFPP